MHNDIIVWFLFLHIYYRKIIVFAYLYVAVLVATPAYWAVRWASPLECDLVYILEVGVSVT